MDEHIVYCNALEIIFSRDSDLTSTNVRLSVCQSMSKTKQYVEIA